MCIRDRYKALQQRESEKQQAQAAQQEYDELRVADLNALKAKMDAAKESADGSAKERVVAGSIVKQMCIRDRCAAEAQRQGRDAAVLDRADSGTGE